MTKSERKRLAIQRRYKKVNAEENENFKKVKGLLSLTPELEKRLLAKCDGSLLFAVRLALLTGMRKEEILCLRWKDIDFDKKIIKVNVHGSRIVEITPEVSALLATISRNGDDVFVFSFREGLPIPSHALTTRLERACIRAKIPNIPFHVFRFTYHQRQLRGKGVLTNEHI